MDDDGGAQESQLILKLMIGLKTPSKMSLRGMSLTLPYLFWEVSCVQCRISLISHYLNPGLGFYLEQTETSQQLCQSTCDSWLCPVN